MAAPEFDWSEEFPATGAEVDALDDEELFVEVDVVVLLPLEVEKATVDDWEAEATPPPVTPPPTPPELPAVAKLDEPVIAAVEDSLTELDPRPLVVDEEVVAAAEEDAAVAEEEEVEAAPAAPDNGSTTFRFAAASASK